MRTVGIDLAAQSRKTAVCAIDWLDGDVRVTTPAAGYADPELLDCIDDAEAVGIDAPFGWPDFITENLEPYAESGTWPLRPDDRPVKEWAETLLYRETDRAVRRAFAKRDPPVKINALSVSSDRIAVCAWRCAALLTQAAQRSGRRLDRVGTDSHLYEVYPAASLESWRIPRKGYKPTGPGKGVPAREKIADRLAAELPWLDYAERPDLRTAFSESDDLLDAFIASLTARAAFLNLTELPAGEEQWRLAGREGWIHVPEAESLAALERTST